MLEGALIWDATGENSVRNQLGQPWYVGEHVDEVFNRLNPKLREGERPQFLDSIDDVINGNRAEDLQEHEIGKAPYPFLQQWTWRGRVGG
jgi:hypothetical protein